MRGTDDKTIKPPLRCLSIWTSSQEAGIYPLLQQLMCHLPMSTCKRDRYTPTCTCFSTGVRLKIPAPSCENDRSPTRTPPMSLPKRTGKTEITPGPYLHKNKSTSSIHSVVSVGTHRSQQPIAPQRHSRRHRCIFVIRRVERQAYK